MKKIALSDEVKAESVADRMAAMTAGLSGADIANICNEAALRAVCFCFLFLFFFLIFQK